MTQEAPGLIAKLAIHLQDQQQIRELEAALAEAQRERDEAIYFEKQESEERVRLQQRIKELERALRDALESARHLINGVDCNKINEFDPQGWHDLLAKVRTHHCGLGGVEAGVTADSK